jgi:arylsulfatase A-like enzyme
MLRYWVAVLLVLTVSGGCRRSIKGGRTNVILIMIDTLRADHLGCYQYHVDVSPNIDKLCREGVQFWNWHSTSSWTRPGMATIVSGHYPGTVGVYEEKYDQLPPDVVLLSERLAEKGYLTLGVNANPNLNAVFGFSQGFEAYRDAGVVWGWMKSGGLPGEKVFASAKNNSDKATQITSRALEAVDHFEDKTPFYLQLTYIDPHWPYKPSPANRETVEVGGSEYGGYDGDILYVDTEIQRLLVGLEERGLMKDTLLIITSDHGEGLDDHPGSPDSDQHGNYLYDTHLRVPLILSHPSLPAGHRIDDMSSSLNLVPTIMDLLGWPVTDGELPGISVKPLIQKTGSVQLPEKIYAETDFRNYRKFSVRTEVDKFIRNDDSLAYQEDGAHEGTSLSDQEKAVLTKTPKRELYSMVDGLEYPARNQVRQKPERAEILKQDLQAWEEAVGRRVPIRRSQKDVFILGDGTVVRSVDASAEEPELDADTLERLRALGYMD